MYRFLKWNNNSQIVSRDQVNKIFQETWHESVPQGNSTNFKAAFIFYRKSTVRSWQSELENNYFMSNKEHAVKILENYEPIMELPTDSLLFDRVMHQITQSSGESSQQTKPAYPRELWTEENPEEAKGWWHPRGLIAWQGWMHSWFCRSYTIPAFKTCQGISATHQLLCQQEAGGPPAMAQLELFIQCL